MEPQNEIQDTRTAAGQVIAYRRLPGAALLAAVVAAVVNALVYFAASGLGAIPRDILLPLASGEAPLTVGPVVITSVVGAIGAAIAFAVIGLFAQRPIRLFRIVSIVALVLSFGAPFSVPGLPVAMIISLEMMHVVAWAVIVGLLTTLVREEEHA